MALNSYTFSTYRRLTFFWHDSIKQIAINGLQLLQSKLHICLVGYVIMPEHMHLLIYPHPRGDLTPIAISILLHAYKSMSAMRGRSNSNAWQIRRTACGRLL